GPLLQLNPTTGAILAQYGDGITQSVEVDPASGTIYVSSGRGVETFDPTTGKFKLFSKTRVGSLAFSPDGTLWGAAWPDRGNVVQFDAKGNASVKLRFDTPIDSLAFGATGTPLAGLMFVTNTPDESEAAGQD